MHMDNNLFLRVEKMRNWGSAVLLIVIVTFGLIFLIKGIEGCAKADLDPETTTEAIANNIIADTVFAYPESLKTDKKDIRVENGIKAVRAIEPQVKIKTVGYDNGIYLCDYTITNMNSVTERYSVGYKIEERQSDGRFGEFLRLGDLDLGPVQPGASRNLDFTIPEFERRSGGDYRIKVEVANPDKHRGEPVASASYRF